MRTLLVDNHDSYTFNLFQLIAAVNGAEPTVLTNDDPLLLRLPAATFDNIVISPRPRPQCPRDLGHVAELLRYTVLPVLGVCLGHQAIAWQAGATVGPAPKPRHGYLSRIKHDRDELFAGIPSEFTAVRYHSLCVEESLPNTLAATAWAEDGVVMAVRHQALPRWGVQFHPESVASEFGRQLITNFAALTPRRAHHRYRATATASPRRSSGPRQAVPLQLISRTLPVSVDAETMFAELFASSPTCFWLDSSMVKAGLSRFSFLGDGSGPLSETLTYRVGSGNVQVSDVGGVRLEPGSAFDVLERRLRDRRLPDPGLPFDFTCGYVGYFGYEMKADCGAAAHHVAETPDAVWVFADRLIALDHETSTAYLLAAHDGTARLETAAHDWLDRTTAQLTQMEVLPDLPAKPDPFHLPYAGTGSTDAGGTLAGLTAHLVRDKASYLADIAECKRQLAAGESYEICLTNRLRLPSGDADLAFYRRLRRANPAPYAAFLRAADVIVFSSSPERFLRLTPEGTVETKPIKGTAARQPDPAQDARVAAELAASAKNQAENLMIVDLLRNDLGRVCRVGSVRVAEYMAVESYATVHHLVSTIQGVLSPHVTEIDCVRQCFPGGSMTGAPKLRTMEIIDRLETQARGVYSGALGYFGLSGGADLSIVIRTAVRHDDTLTVGAGGAIVLDSVPADEYDEMLVKAAAPLRAYRPRAQAGPTA
jgi:para-aminobenzoate synthetase